MPFEATRNNTLNFAQLSLAVSRFKPKQVNGELYDINIRQVSVCCSQLLCAILAVLLQQPLHFDLDNYRAGNPLSLAVNS